MTQPSFYVVMSEQEECKPLARALREIGSIQLADSLDTLMTRHNQDKATLVILDSEIPAVNGAISALKHAEMPPIVMILATPDDPRIEQWLHAGVDDVLTKPITPLLLRKRVLTQLTLRALSTDITSTAKAPSEDANDYENIFLAANDAILLLDVITGKFIDSNHRATSMFGYSREQFKTLRIEDLYASLENSDELSLGNLTTKGSFIFENIYLTKSGKQIPVEVSARLIRYRGRVVMLNFIRDITNRKKIHQEEVAQRQLAEALRSNAETINTSLDLNKVINRLLQQVYKLVDCDAINLALIEGERSRIIAHIGYGNARPFDDTALMPGWNYKRFENMRQVIEDKQPLLINNTHSHELWELIEQTKWILSHASVPIMYDGEVIGLLNMDAAKTDAFDEKVLEILQAFANQAGIAIRNARLYTQVQTHAETLEKHVEKRTAELVNINAELETQIAENKRIEAALNTERTLLRTVIDTVPDYVYVKDLEGRLILINKYTQESLASYATDNQPLGKTDFDLMPAEDAEKISASEQEIFRTGVPMINHEELSIPDENGDRRVFLVSKIPLRDQDGNITGLVGVNRDVTDVRRLDQERTRERQLLRTVIDHIPDDVYVKDTEGHFVLVNKAVETRLKTYLDPGETVIGTTNARYMPEERRKLRDAMEQRVMESDEPIINDEIEITLTDGKTHQQLATKVPLHDESGNIIGLLGINRDITEIRAATRALENERVLLRALLDNLPDRIYVKDREGRFLLANQATRNFHAGKDIIGLTDLDLSPEHIATPVFEAEQSLMAHGKLSQNILHKDTDGNNWLLITKAPLRDADGKIIGLVGINRDITELKRSQDSLEHTIKELQGAEERLQHLITGARALLWYAIVQRKDDVTDHTPDALHWNTYISSEDAAQQFLPLDLNVGESYMEAWQRNVFDEDQRESRWRSYKAIIDNAPGYQQEVRVRSQNGNMRWFFEDVRITALTDGRWSAVGIVTDITERKIAEQALRDTNELLEERVATRTRELTRVNAQERAQRILAEALSDAAAALSSSLELDDVLDRILTYASRVMPRHSASNVLLIENDVYARVIRARAYATQTNNYQSITDDSFFRLSALPTIETIIETGDTVTTRTTDTPPAWLHISEDKPIKSYISAPIFTGGNVTGVISFGSTEAYRFDTGDADRLLSFTNQAGIAIRNAQLYEAVVEQANKLEEMVKARTLELELERRQLRAILNGMTEGVIYYDTDGEMRYINQSLEQLTGFPASDWQETSGFRLALDLPDAERATFMTEMLDNVTRLGISRREVEMVTKDGHPFTASLTISAVQNDEEQIVGFVFVVRDISKEKQLENQKSRFIANASHELRTPITNIKTRLYLISRQKDKLDEHLSVMTSVTDRMRNLVNDLLDVSRFDNNMIRLNITQQPIQKVVGDVVNVQKVEAELKGIDLIAVLPSTSIELMLDYSRMHQVMTNLITNAIHYTPQGGKITVTVTDEDDKVRIHVKDTGYGIPSDLLPNIFEPFIRGKESHEHKGAGLGLSITRDIIELHNGQITVESEEEVGTIFTVTLHKMPEYASTTDDAEQEK